MLKEYIEQLNKLPQKIFVNSVQIDTKKISIGIITAQNELALAHKDLQNLCQKVKEGVLACGGDGKILHVSCVDDTLLRDTPSAKYSLPSRDLTASQVEMLCSADCFDGLVFVASQPNTVFGMLLGAIRLNIPCAFLCQGTMSPIVFEGVQYGYAHYAEQIAKLKRGRTPYESLTQIENNLPFCFGLDCDSYSDNSINCLLEVVGLAVKGNGTAFASGIERLDIARKTGALCVELAQNKCTPRRVLTQKTVENLIKLDLACGGSTTTMLNLIAISKELGLRNISLKHIGEMAKETPLLLCKQDKTVCLMQQFHQAGGALALAKQMIADKLIDGDVEISNGESLSSLVQEVKVNDTDVIRSAEKALSKGSTLQVLYGNLAEEGCFVRAPIGKTYFEGKAKVYANEEMAIDAIMHREIAKGDVLVIRNEGPTSCPGMREICLPFALLKGYELAEEVAIITDGRITDGYEGFAVGHVTPETNGQNAFSVLQDGDRVEISITKGKISCDLKAKEVAIRLRSGDAVVGNYANPYLKQWSKNCDTATNGCVTIVKK